MQNVTKAQAERVYRAVCKRFGTEPQPVADASLGERWNASTPALVREWGYCGPTRWAIVWEEGPYDWAMGLMGGYDELSYLMAEVGAPLKPQPVLDTPKGVYVEPITGWAVAIYPV